MRPDIVIRRINQRRRPRLKIEGVIISVFVILAALFLGGTSLVGCAENYSSGDRVGIITKLSEKGLVIKSWEGELLMALPIDVSGTTQPEKFDFNVDPAAVSKVKEALVTGKRVQVIYRQWLLHPIRIESNTVVTDVIETETKKKELVQ